MWNIVCTGNLNNTRKKAAYTPELLSALCRVIAVELRTLLNYIVFGLPGNAFLSGFPFILPLYTPQNGRYCCRSALPYAATCTGTQRELQAKRDHRIEGRNIKRNIFKI